MNRVISKSIWIFIVVAVALMTTSCPPPITPDMVTFAEDETPPTIEIISPLNYSYYYTTLSVIGVLTDSAVFEDDEKGRLDNFSFAVPGLPSLEFDFSVAFDYVNETHLVTPANDQTSVNFSYDFSTGAFSFSFLTLGVLDGNYELIFTAEDWRGNERDVRVPIQKNNNGPSIDIITVDPSVDNQSIYYSTTAPRTITVTGSFGDTFLNGDYEIRDFGDLRLDWQSIPAAAPNFDFSFAFNTGGLVNTNTLIIHANGNSEDEYLTLLINEDSVAPSLLKHVSLTSDNVVDDGYGSVGNVVTLRFDADDILDPAGINITIQGELVPENNISLFRTYSDGGSFYEWHATHVLEDQVENNELIQFTISQYDDRAGNSGLPINELHPAVISGVTYDDSVPDLYAITVSSDNAVNADRATTGDTVNVQFWHTSPLDEVTNPPVVTILGRAASGLVMNVPDGLNFRSTAQVQVQGTDPESPVAFQISNVYNNLGVQSVPASYNAVTDTSLVVIDRTPPAAMASPAVTVTGSDVIPGYWNSTSTGFSLSVNIPNDVSLLHGGAGANGHIQIQASQDGGSYGDIGSTKPITAIGAGDVFSLSAADLNAYDSTISEDTDITLRAVLHDTSGNASTGAASASITYDETAPTVSITGPAANTRTDGSASLTYTTDGIDSATARLNGTWYGFTSGSSLSSIGSFAGLGEGPFTVVVRDRDAAGNYDTSSRTLIKDTVAPTVAVSYDASGDTDGYYNDSQTLTIYADFNESMALTPDARITINAPVSGGITSQSMTWTSATRAEYTDFNVGGGTETATVTITTAEDSAGNAVSGAPTSGGTFAIDNTPPTVAITYSDLDLYFNSGQNITITATFSQPMGNSPLPSISSSDGPDTISGQMSWFSSTVATYSYIVGSGNGTGTITISAAEDIANNEVNNTPTSGVTFHVDNIDPTVTIDSPIPPDSTDVWGSDTATFTFDDDTGWADSTLEVRIVGVGNWQTLVNTHYLPVPTLQFDALLSWGTLNDSDDFELRVRHTDAAGNSITDTRDYTKIVP